jgi:hypothetical protein
VKCADLARHEELSGEAATEKKNGRKERKGRKKESGVEGGFETRPLGFGASRICPSRANITDSSAKYHG